MSRTTIRRNRFRPSRLHLFARIYLRQCITINIYRYSIFIRHSSKYQSMLLLYVRVLYKYSAVEPRERKSWSDSMWETHRSPEALKTNRMKTWPPMILIMTSWACSAVDSLWNCVLFFLPVKYTRCVSIFSRTESRRHFDAVRVRTKVGCYVE